jgi:hypothetical protein
MLDVNTIYKTVNALRFTVLPYLFIYLLVCLFAERRCRVIGWVFNEYWFAKEAVEAKFQVCRGIYSEELRKLFFPALHLK